MVRRCKESGSPIPQFSDSAFAINAAGRQCARMDDWDRATAAARASNTPSPAVLPDPRDGATGQQRCGDEGPARRGYLLTDDLGSSANAVIDEEDIGAAEGLPTMRPPSRWSSTAVVPALARMPAMVDGEDRVVETVPICNRRRCSRGPAASTSRCRRRATEQAMPTPSAQGTSALAKVLTAIQVHDDAARAPPSRGGRMIEHFGGQDRRRATATTSGTTG